jgi:acetolactate synthase I/III small subunit
MSGPVNRHTISALVENRPGVLARVAGLFGRRGFNIHSLAVGTTTDPDLSRMSIVVEGDDHTIEQVTKQLNKLIDVVKVSDLTQMETVDRELTLIKVNADTAQRIEIMQLADTFRGKITDVADKSLIVEVTGRQEKIAAMERLLKKYGVIEVMRSGKIVLVRGSQPT